jgi:serine/threonine-protein kinase RsbW
VLIDCSLPATPQNVACARRMLDEVVAQLGVPEEERAQLQLALSEACTNAVLHGSPGGSASTFRLRCLVREHLLVLEIQDEGGGFEYRGATLPEPDDLQSHGRGLFLMQQLVDRLEFDRRPDGMVVRLCKKLSNGAAI